MEFGALDMPGVGNCLSGEGPSGERGDNGTVISALGTGSDSSEFRDTGTIENALGLRNKKSEL